LHNTDVSLAVGKWLANPQNNQQVSQLIQQIVPKIFEFVGQEQIGRFIQNNSVQWVKNTDINYLASEMLRAVLENDFHQDVLQRGLDLAHDWMLQHPEETRELTRTLFKELGVWRLARGASWIGIDVQQRTIDSLLERVDSMLADPDHPWRQNVEDMAHQLMQQLADQDSSASQRLNQTKNALLDSPQVLNFISGAVVILCDAIRADLEKPDSGIAENLRVAIQQVGENIISNGAVRQLLNDKMSGIAVNLSDQYSEKVIRFISERIHEWDSREMIGKIENEVGGDLH
ncbi:membrane protein, partial [Xanthomonas oryzae pv. oryzae]